MKNIRSKVVRESLLDYNALAKSLQENTEGAVKNLLSETVRDTYAKLLSEDLDDKEYKEDDVDIDGGVEDTADASGSNNAEVDAASADGAEDVDAGMDADADAEGGEELPADGGEEPAEGGEELGAEGEADAEGDDWAEFDKYKVSDDEYDFSNAEDEEIVKVYKLMKNDDQILVHKDDDKVKIQDNETGAEYIVDLGGDNEAAGVAAVEPGEDEPVDANFVDDAEGDDVDGNFSDDDEFNNEDDMNESTERMFELVLEYDSNVGYTDNYQKKDVMTTPGMSEPGKNVNDWDAGVPKGKSKPWSGKKGNKSENQPFDAEKGKTVEEGAVNELKTNAEHSANIGSTSRTDGPNNPRGRKGRSFHTAQNGQETGTGDNAYKGNGNGGGNNVEVDVKVESIMKKVNKTLKENKELKETLNTVMTSLKEAAVTNHNLAQIIKLISENSTTKEEKEEIIRKFANEAKTIDASKTLYESISNDLKKTKKMNITEDKNLSVESSKKINETTIYKSQDIMESLDLMHRMMK